MTRADPDGSGQRIFAQLNADERILRGGFLRPAGRSSQKSKNSTNRRSFPPGCEGISHGIGISPDHKTLWTNSRPANAVFVYSLPDRQLMGRWLPFQQPKCWKWPRGGGPAWVTFTPDSKTVYVSTCGTKSITAIDVIKAIKEVGQIPVHEMPDRISTLVLP